MADQLLGGIVINEILVDPNGTNNFDTDGNGTADHTDEFIELKNVSDSAIDISGVELWDSTIGRWFTFPSGTVLQPGGHALVVAGVQSGGSLPSGGPNDLAFDAGRTGAVINNGGDNVVAYDPASDEFVQATFNGDPLDDPTSGTGYSGFSSTASRLGSGEDFGNDIDGFSLQRTPNGGDVYYNEETPTPAAQNVCFCSGTRIAISDRDDIPVETIQPGQLVQTFDHGPRPVFWTCSRRFTPWEVTKEPALRPVLISQGALGCGLSKRDLRVSQQHRMLVRGPIADRMFGTQEVLVPAKSLINSDSIVLETPPESIVYHHIALARHEVIFGEGAPTESFYPGRQALRALPSKARREFLLLSADIVKEKSVPARRLIGYRRAKRLAQRQEKNYKRPLEWSEYGHGTKNGFIEHDPLL